MQKKITNNKLLVPFIITLIGTVLMLATIFLPYATATEEHAERLNMYADSIVYEELNITSKDMVNVSMVDYARIYSNLSEQVFGNSVIGIICAVFVILIGSFSLLAILFSVIKKPIAVIIFSLLSLCAFSIQNFDYSDRGVIPNSSYDWGIAYYIFYVATIVVFVGAIWMLVCKIKQKRRDKLESDT